MAAKLSRDVASTLKHVGSDSQNQMQNQSTITPRHGFIESHSENMLRDSVLLGAALTGATTALILHDEAGTWYRDSSDLTSDQMESLEHALSEGLTEASEARFLREQGLQIMEKLPLVDDCHRAIGSLCVLSAVPLTLTEAQQQGLKLLAEHVQTIVRMDQHKVESRTEPRPPSAASFVPGLVHELGSFIFGISANLDAFEARFTGMDEVSKYGANIRKSLDRMSAFIVELREYGYPQRLSWSVLELEPLLREAIEQHRAAAATKNIDLQVSIEGALPLVSADGEGLRSAFIRVLGLVLQQQEPGSRVVLHASSNHNGHKDAIYGSLDFSSVKFKDVDPARLFEPFYFRVSGLGRLTRPGARRVFESHGGTLTAGPGPEGGMRINFMLPAEGHPPLRSADQP
jgi:signal transduction histidine kinase